ncbi:MAG: RNA polymerase sigma-70 factor ECF subfamily [Rhodospirillaceae bacterium]|nr:MAG: RNA polymerase sigma-70 factor ECF subfamily [Rhodospirillaceae bacterium]
MAYKNDDPWDEWIRSVQDGNAMAYRHLLTGIAAVVQKVILHCWGSVENIEDVVQDVLLSVHTVPPHTYDPDRPFQPWLYAIVRHRMADATCHYVRRAANEVTVDSLPEISGDPATNFHEDDVNHLRQAIAALPPAQRQAVEMLKLNEMSLKEVSAVSGQSVAALKVAMHRAMETLKRVLRPER